MVDVALCDLLPLVPATLASASMPPRAGRAVEVPSTWDFLERIAISNMFDIESSRLALSRTMADGIKVYADRMIVDRIRAATSFTRAAADAGLESPDYHLDLRHQALLDSLRREADGAAFDTACIRSQRESQGEIVALCEAYAKDGENARIRRFAHDFLPVLRNHLDLASHLG
ncbi:MAG: DUF4142 domain-containing protein [Pseudomonadota bacterium]